MATLKPKKTKLKIGCCILTLRILRGVVQNDKNSVYLYVTKTGETPDESTGVYLEGGIGKS